VSKEILFSITAKDCEWSYTKGSGPGGQKKNKTSSAVHCSHLPSGARGYAEDSRSQIDNRRTAFERMVGTREFEAWIKAETARRNGTAAAIDAEVARQLRNIKVEIKDHGLWKEVDKNAPLPDNQ